MIAVTGATGHLGRLAIAELLKTVPASQVVALARTPAKASDLAEKGGGCARPTTPDPGR